MNITKIVMGLLLVLFTIAPLMGNETSESPINTFSFTNFSSSSAEVESAEYSGGGAAGAVGVGSSCGGAFVLSLIITPLVFTGLYIEGIGDIEMQEKGMIGWTSALNAVAAIGLTFGVSMFAGMGLPIATTVFSLSCFTIATGTLVSGILLTDRYLRLGDRSREVITGLTWSWSTFAATIIPALTGGVLGIIFGAIYYMDNIREKRKRVSLLLAPDRVGVSILL